MQATGTLKKRRRRNLTKVLGLTLIPYNESADSYDGTNLFDPKSENLTDLEPVYGGFLSITISKLLGYGHPTKVIRNKSGARVTRDPIFTIKTSELDDVDLKSEDSIEPPLEVGLSPPPKLDLEAMEKDEGETITPVDPFPLSPMTMMILQVLICSVKSSMLLPWSWNKKTRRIEKWSPFWCNFLRCVLFCFIVQSASILCFQFYIVKVNMAAVTAGTSNYRNVFKHFMIVFWYILATMNSLAGFIFGKRTLLYINALLDFNELYTARYVLDKKQFVEEKWYIFAMVFPEVWFHIPVCIYNYVVAPQLPFYLSSYIIQPDSSWYWLIPGIIHEYALICLTLSGNILSMWCVFAHSNSLDFWLEESHRDNETGQTKTQLRDPKRAIETYKCALILTSLFNDCMGAAGIAICKAQCFFAFIPCAFVCIRTTSQMFVDEFPSIIPYITGVPATFSIALIAIALSAKVFDVGISFLDCWDSTRQKNLRRILMSCPTIKVKVGALYFITISTTVTFFKIVIDYLIDFIITFPP